MLLTDFRLGIFAIYRKALFFRGLLVKVPQMNQFAIHLFSVCFKLHINLLHETDAQQSRIWKIVDI